MKWHCNYDWQFDMVERVSIKDFLTNKIIIMKFRFGKLGFAFLILLLVSCSKEESNNPDIGGALSEFGEVGNELYLQVGQLDVVNATAKVSELNDGVSTFEISGETTNSAYIDLLKMIPSSSFPGTFSVNEGAVEATVNAKFTEEGAQYIFNDGSKMTVVKYDSEVGDNYISTIDGDSYELEVVEKSTEDDYLWVGGLYLKIMTVRATNPSPGVKYIDGYWNHKYALVGSAITFEDGSVKYIGVDGF